MSAIRRGKRLEPEGVKVEEGPVDNMSRKEKETIEQREKNE